MNSSGPQSPQEALPAAEGPGGAAVRSRFPTHGLSSRAGQTAGRTWSALKRSPRTSHPVATMTHGYGGAVRESRLPAAVDFSVDDQVGWASRASPTSLPMTVGKDDHLTPTDLALTAHERALEPKRPTRIDGGHFGPQSSYAAQSALDWFREHLT